MRPQHRGAAPALGAAAEPSPAAAAAPAGEALPGLLTNGKAELRLDATVCSVWFYTLKNLFVLLDRDDFVGKSCQIILIHSSGHKQELGGGTKLQTKYGGQGFVICFDFKN